MLFPTLCLTLAQLQVSNAMSLEKLWMTFHSKSYLLFLFFILPFNLSLRALTSTCKHIIVDMIICWLCTFIPQLHIVRFLYPVFAMWGCWGGRYSIWRDNSSLCHVYVRFAKWPHLANNSKSSVLRTTIDILLTGLAGLSWAGFQVPSLLSCLFLSQRPRRGAVAAWVGSHDGWNEHERVMETQKGSCPAAQTDTIPELPTLLWPKQFLWPKVNAGPLPSITSGC